MVLPTDNTAIAWCKYGWAFLLVCGLANIRFMRRHVRPYVSARPELAAGYHRLLRGLAFWMNLPWLVTGIGCTIGGVPTFLHFIFPVVGGPFVWAFWVVVYAEFLLLAFWAIWCGGAEDLVAHPGLINFHTSKVGRMRWFLASVAVFLVASNTGFLIWFALL